MSSNGAALHSVQAHPEFAGILRERSDYSAGQTESVSDRVNGWFDRLMLQSGIRIHPAAYLMLCIFAAVAVGGLVLMVTNRIEPAIWSAVVGMTIPLIAAVVIRARRQKKMMNQMPAMIEELARAAKTGRSVEQCFHVVAHDTPAPLGSELQESARRTMMGIDLTSAIQDLPERTGLVSMNVFTTSLAVHQQTGGDLVSVLERLAQAVRDRLLFIGRLSAATAASRATAILMVAVLPIIILGFFLFRDPEYFDKLFSSGLGKLTFWLAVGLETIGALGVYAILKRSRRT